MTVKAREVCIGRNPLAFIELRIDTIYYRERWLDCLRKVRLRGSGRGCLFGGLSHLRERPAFIFELMADGVDRWNGQGGWL